MIEFKNGLNQSEINRRLMLTLISKYGVQSPCSKEAIAFYQSHVILQSWHHEHPSN